MRACLVVLCCAACGGDPHAPYAVDPAQSLLETDRDTAVAGGTAIAITVTLRDGTGEPIAGAEVVLSATGDANTLSLPPPTDALGVTHAAWTSTRSGDKDLTAAIGETTLGPHPVTFVAGPPVAIAFLVPPSSAAAGGPIEPGVSVGAVDALGNLVVSLSGTVTLAIAANPGSTVLAGHTAAGFGPDGIAPFPDLHIDVAGAGYTLYANAGPLGDTTSPAFDILAGDPDAAQSTLVAAPPSVDADGVATTTLTATFVNTYGIPIAGAPIELTASGSDNTLSPSSGTTDPAGHFVATFASLTPETKTVEAHLGSAVASTSVAFFVPACTPMLPGPAWRLLADLTARAIVADMDGDGHLDAILYEAGQIMVYRGRGDGGFFPGLGVPFGSFAYRMTTGDFDGDGHLDLALVTPTGHWVARGTGDGHLLAPIELQIPNATFNVAAGDFNHDGRDDLLVDGTGSALQVLFGQADGTFAPGPAIGVTDGCADIAVVDLDDDGNLDIVASCSGIQAALGHGDGTFGAVATSPTFDRGPLSFADVDGDGLLDAVILDSDRIVVLPGTNTASFATPRTLATNDDFVVTTGDPARVAILDVDGDGHLDLVVPETSTIDVLRGAGDGTFTPSASYASDVMSATVADMTDDGIADIVSVGAGGKLGTVLGVPGGYLAPRGYPRSTGSLLAVGDFNNDGRSDVVDWDGGAIRIALAGPGGVLGPPQARVDNLPTAAATGDVDGDGKLDLVVVVGATVHTMLGTGTGGLQPFTSQPGGGTAIALADLDGDGRADLITVRASGVSFSPSLGNGSFGAAVTISSHTGPTLAADLDGDGVADIAVLGPPGTLLVYSGGFASPVLSMTGGYVGPLAAADFDGDGRVDVAILMAGNLAVLRGLGGGMFAAPLVTPNLALPMNSFVRAILATDLSGDGVPDVVIDTSFGASVTIGFGDGYVRPRPLTYGFGAGGPLALGDFDGDGRSDLAFWKQPGIGIALTGTCAP